MRTAQPSALLIDKVPFAVELEGKGAAWVGVNTGSESALSSGNGIVASGLGW
jgi:hypothetical protein